jgi:hypothetical protein
MECGWFVNTEQIVVIPDKTFESYIHELCIIKISHV